MDSVNEFNRKVIGQQPLDWILGLVHTLLMHAVDIGASAMALTLLWQWFVSSKFSLPPLDFWDSTGICLIVFTIIPHHLNKAVLAYVDDLQNHLIILKVMVLRETGHGHATSYSPACEELSEQSPPLKKLLTQHTMMKTFFKLLLLIAGRLIHVYT